MSWKDAPIVEESSKWQDAPVVGAEVKPQAQSSWWDVLTKGTGMSGLTEDYSPESLKAAAEPAVPAAGVRRLLEGTIPGLQLAETMPSVKGATEAVSEFGSGLTSPAAVVPGVVAAAFPPSAPFIGIGFGAKAALDLPENAARRGTASVGSEGSLAKEMMGLGLDVGGTGLMLGGSPAGARLLKEQLTPKRPPLLPLAQKVLDGLPPAPPAPPPPDVVDQPAGLNVTPEARAALEKLQAPTPDAVPAASTTPTTKPTDVGYHYGDNQTASDTTLSRMGGRSTGHFGTGVYFLGSETPGEPRANRPLTKIDLTDLNLAKPAKSDVFTLHDALKMFNNAVMKGENLDFNEPRFTGSKTLSSLRISLGFVKHSEAEIVAAMKNVEALFKTGQNDGLRTPATYLMQELGYDGIDVRGTRADNTDYGSVIFHKTPADIAPTEVTKTSKSKSTLPDYIREEMLRRGLNPNRTFNDADLQNQSVVDAIKMDPTLTNAEKESLLRTGSITAPTSTVSPEPPLDNPPDTTASTLPAPLVPQAGVHYQAEGIPVSDRPLGIVAPNSVGFFDTLFNLRTAPWLKQMAQNVVLFKRGLEMQALPKITDADRVTGEKGVRYVASFDVAKAKGLEFAAKVLEDLDVDPLKFGSALTEDNLRSVREGYKKEAQDALAAGKGEDALLYNDAANSVSTMIGEKGAFKTEQEYQDYLKNPDVQEAIKRHIQLWQEQKDPLFRQANGLDPDIELPTRGLQTGARINLMPVFEDQPGIPTGKITSFRQLATLMRRDPFGRRAAGTGKVYEGNYHAIMANGFGREMPVALQHEFIKSLVDSGNAEITEKMMDKNLTIKGEPTESMLLRLKPWTGRFLQVRKSLAEEARVAMGLDTPRNLGVFTDMSRAMTTQSVKGLSEGSTHASNLMMRVFTGPGPTANPLINALIKSMGRPDLVYTIPKTIIGAFIHDPKELMPLAEIGAAKEPYTGVVSGPLLNNIDKAVRLDSAQLYKNMAAQGWVVDTETGLREFVNRVGNYNKRLQPWFVRRMRETGVNPFATAVRNFTSEAVRIGFAGPGAKAPTNLAALALRADVIGGWIGFVVFGAALNTLLSGHPEGPKGTKFGDIGWVGDDGKTHTFPLGALSGYGRTLRITGVGKLIEAAQQGVSPNIAATEAAQSLANTAISQVTGPAVRFLSIAATGKTPGIPAYQAAPLAPPQEDFHLFKSQIAKNIVEALKEVNPIVNSTIDASQGKSLNDIMQQQLTRYTPREVSSLASSGRLGEVKNLISARDYADGLAAEAKKLPHNKRADFIQSRLAEDQVPPIFLHVIAAELRKKGAYKY